MRLGKASSVPRYHTISRGRRQRRRPTRDEVLWLTLSALAITSAAWEVAAGYPVNAFISSVYSIVYFDEWHQARLGHSGLATRIPWTVWCAGSLIWLFAVLRGLR